MTDPILIWGAGAIGGVFGAFWARAGIPVLLVDIDAAHVAVCRESGLKISGPVEAFTIRVPAITPAEIEGVFGRIVLAVKAPATEAATRALAPHLADDGFVLSAQNGLNEHVIARIVGERRTMGAFVNFGADLMGPGEILLGNRGAVVIGEVSGPPTTRTHLMLSLLQVFEPGAILTDDIWSFLWGKLGYGALLFATALNHDTMTENFEDPARIPLLIGLGREVMAVAEAEGVQPRGFNGFDPAAFAPAATDAAARASIAALAEFNRHSAKPRTGVWRDLAVRRRRTEVDPMMTAVTEIGRRRGVQTPLLDRLVALIKEIEAGRRTQSAETFAALAGALP